MVWYDVTVLPTDYNATTGQTQLALSWVVTIVHLQLVLTHSGLMLHIHRLLGPWGSTYDRYRPVRQGWSV